LLLPLFHDNLTKSERDSLGTTILNLSRDALALGMIMRQSDEGYKCERLEVDKDRRVSLAKNEALFDAVAIEGGKFGDRSDDVAYVLFGPLLKRLPGQPLKILEKGQVVLKRRNLT
jgi:hypothetical protein